MTSKITLKNKTIYYDLQYKKVKNINLRIRPDGTVHVSANMRVPIRVVEAFLESKGEFIVKALERYAAKPSPQQHFKENEIQDVIKSLCDRAYPYFKKRGIPYPQIKFRKMVSRWGSCNPAKGILTFNTNLMYAPLACIEYVVLHEFTHFLKPNHSRAFYEELENVCPNWNECRNRLKEIYIR